jgi:hypothetical protein
MYQWGEARRATPLHFRFASHTPAATADRAAIRASQRDGLLVDREQLDGGVDSPIRLAMARSNPPDLNSPVARVRADHTRATNSLQIRNVRDTRRT